MGRPRSAGPQASDLHRLGDRQIILEFDAEVAHRAVHPGVTEQELHRSEVTCIAVCLRNLSSAHGMGAISLGSSPMEVTLSRTSRAYSRVEMWRRLWKRPGQRRSDPSIIGASNQFAIALRVPSVISKDTGLCVLL